MDHLCTMELFGMQIQCRPDWRIVPDHKYTLTYDSGLFRFEENVEERRSRVSLGLRWECSMTDSETFLEEFRENIQAEYRKAIKGKGRRFELLRDEIVERPQNLPGGDQVRRHPGPGTRPQENAAPVCVQRRLLLRGVPPYADLQRGHHSPVYGRASG